MASSGKLAWALLGAVSVAAGLGLLWAKLSAESQPLRGARHRVSAESESPIAAESSGAAMATPLPRPAMTRRTASTASTPPPIRTPPTTSAAPEAPTAPTPLVQSAAPPPAPPAPVAAAPASAEPAPPTRTPPRLWRLRLAAWTQPGLCSTTEAAAATRDKLTARFRQFDTDSARLFLDPRLSPKAENAVLELLAQARTAVEEGLGVQPAPPSVFVYFDQSLMKAAACINEDVVAFYDGALHLVVGRDDLQQSVTHEYTHHALFGSGLVGPAWAQEGIAMILSGELWWQQRARLQSLLRAPFSAEQMDELIPYKLPAQQAAVFYVQAALTARCLMRVRGWSLQQLADALRSSSESSISDEFPELTDSSFLRGCVASL